MDFQIRSWARIFLFVWFFDIASSIIIFYMGGSDMNPLYYSEDPFFKSIVLIVVHLIAAYGIFFFTIFFRYRAKGLPFFIGTLLYVAADLNNVWVFLSMMGWLPQIPYSSVVHILGL